MKITLVRSMARSAVFELVNSGCYRAPAPYTVSLDGATVCEGDTNKKIQALEVLHQKYDMFHNFVRLFGMPGRQNWDKKLIRKRKKEISKELTDTIREKKLKRRKCMVCGRNLPFGYPYKLCQPCFEKKKFFEDFFETVDM